MYLCRVKKLTLLLVLSLFTVTLSYSQATFDDHTIDVAVPVDGGIVTVVGSALIYGMYRSREKRKG